MFKSGLPYSFLNHVFCLSKTFVWIFSQNNLQQRLVFSNLYISDKYENPQCAFPIEFTGSISNMQTWPRSFWITSLKIGVCIKPKTSIRSRSVDNADVYPYPILFLPLFNHGWSSKSCLDFHGLSNFRGKILGDVNTLDSQIIIYVIYWTYSLF